MGPSPREHTHSHTHTVTHSHTHARTHRRSYVVGKSDDTCDSGYAALAALCDAHNTKTIAGQSITSVEYMGGVGNDPVFNTLSSLYDAVLAKQPANWYNTSEAAGDVSPVSGLPYGGFIPL